MDTVILTLVALFLLLFWLWQLMDLMKRGFWEKAGFRRDKARGWDEHITEPGLEYYADL